MASLFPPQATLVLLLFGIGSSSLKAQEVLEVTGWLGTTESDLLGVNAGPGNHFQDCTQTSQVYDFSIHYANAGFDRIRSHENMGVLDMSVLWHDRSSDPNDPGNFDWTGQIPWDWHGQCGAQPAYYDSDQAFRQMILTESELLFRIGDSMNSALHHGYDFADPVERNRYADAVVTVVAHYLFDAQRVFGVSFPDARVEIWNEPDNPAFWAHSWSDFLLTYEAVAQRIQQAYPSLRVGGPGFRAESYLIPAERTAKVIPFLDTVVQQGLPLDFLSWHLYGADPQEFSSAASWYRQALDSRGLQATESILSAWNVDPLFGGSWAGAALATGHWLSLQRSSVVDQAYLYRGVVSPDPLCLFRLDSQGLPQLQPLAQVTPLWQAWSSGEQNAMVRYNSADLHVLATHRNSDQSWRVMIGNSGDQPIPWQLQFQISPPCPGTIARLKTISANGETETLHEIGEVITIPAESVQLLEVSARCSLSTDTDTISAGSGGSQTFFLDAGPDYAGKSYLLLGSTAGVVPGLQVDSVLLPLNQDQSYLPWSHAHPNTPPLYQSSGFLDGSGQAIAMFIIPPIPILTGKKIDHAFLVFDTGRAGFASNSTPLIFEF
ncbi:MAG: hypothetical protein DWQ01_12405 [Planctomycetota bacterium]|nr:MAG: hypothetical protein DWQ01_12405 [Planctomycetota bacterium]